MKESRVGQVWSSVPEKIVLILPGDRYLTLSTRDHEAEAGYVYERFEDVSCWYQRRLT